jgi:hypothetical protein
VPAIHHVNRDGLGAFEYAKVAGLPEPGDEIPQRSRGGAAQVAVTGRDLAEGGQFLSQPVPSRFASGFQVSGAGQGGGQPGRGRAVHVELAGDVRHRDDGPVPVEHVEDGEPVQQRPDQAIA